MGRRSEEKEIKEEEEEVTDVLEIGPGRFPAYWPDERYKVTYLDFVENEYTDVVAKWGYEPLPFPDDHFDLVYASHVLEHIPWYLTVDALKEAHRVLKKSGAIEVHVPDFTKSVYAWIDRQPLDDWIPTIAKDKPRNYMTWISSRLLSYGPEKPSWHLALFDPDHLTWCLELAGFKNIEDGGKPRGSDDHGLMNLGIRGYT